MKQTNWYNGTISAARINSRHIRVGLGGIELRGVLIQAASYSVSMPLSHRVKDGAYINATGPDGRVVSTILLSFSSADQRAVFVNKASQLAAKSTKWSLEV